MFAVTALDEITGGYLPWLVLKQGKSALLLLHPIAAGQTYAAHGGMYIAVALIWPRIVDGVALTHWDVTRAIITQVGMAAIALQPAGGEGWLWYLRWLLLQAEAGQELPHEDSANRPPE